MDCLGRIEMNTALKAAMRNRDVERIGSDTAGGLDSADRRYDIACGKARSDYKFYLSGMRNIGD